MKIVKKGSLHYLTNKIQTNDTERQEAIGQIQTNDTERRLGKKEEG